MIEVNLLPGGKKRQSGRPKLGLSLPQIEGLPKDRWVLSACVMGIVAVLAAGYLYVSTNSRHQDLDVQVTQAAQDSARFADLIAATQQLQARRDSIAEKVAIIQNLDGGRYVWPHILDEVARAVPDFTWLTGVVQVQSGEELMFRIDGRVGNTFALTRFMNQLEASPFLRSVELISTEQVVEQRRGGGEGRIVHAFTLQASYQEPPPDILETVPLFNPTAGT